LIKSRKLEKVLNARSRVASLALLCLLGHVLFVSITHHHKPTKINTGTAAHLTDAGHHESGNAPGSNGDSDCFSCRLQRNFTSSIQTASIVVQFLGELQIQDTICWEPRFADAPLNVSGRAPPFV